MFPPPTLTFSALIFTFPFLPITPNSFSHFTYPSGPACSWRGQGILLRWPQEPKRFFSKEISWSLGSTSLHPTPETWLACPGGDLGPPTHESSTKQGKASAEIDSNWNLLSGLTPCDPLFNHVLQIGKPLPDVSEVFHRISSGAGIPVPEKKPERGTRDVDADLTGQLTCYQKHEDGIHSPGNSLRNFSTFSDSVF